MSQKRKHAESSADTGDLRPFSKKQRGASHAPGHNSKHKKRPHKSKSRDEDSNATSNNALKSRIRDLRRLLDHADKDPSTRLPANIRIDRERELEACEHELSEKKAAQKEAEFRRKIIGKYHRIRFFGKSTEPRRVCC
jgi:hypothetical protein